MPTGHEHQVNKVSEKIVNTAITALDDKLVVSNTVTKDSMDVFKGVEGEVLTRWVPGTLPVRTYGWRNDRSEPIRTDVYKETAVTLTMNPNNDYTALKLSDEDLEFDFGGSWGKLFNAQTDAVVDHLERRVLKHILGAPYEVQLSLDPSTAKLQAAHDLGQDLVYNVFADARAALGKMRVPGLTFFALCGTEVAALLRKHRKGGDSVRAGAGDNALASYVIGNYAGIDALESTAVPADEILIYSPSGFVLFTAAPPIPRGAVQGAIQNKNGLSMRWIQDYDSAYQIDRSTFNSWNAQNYTTDLLKQVNEDDTQVLVGKEEYFLRGLRVKLGTTEFKPGDGGSAANGRKGAAASSELAKVWNGEPFTGTLPAGEAYPNVLLTANAYSDANDAGA
jgi:hypothetical protein